MSQTGLIAKPEAADSASDEPEVKQSPRFLLVEGDGFTRLVLLLHLRLAGFKVDFTSNGILGLEKLRNCRPDVLLVELKLCGLSGLELIKAARAEPTFEDRPICVFTHADRMNRTTGRQLRRLGVKLFDKGSITREGLVQTFAAEFLGWKPPGDQFPTGKGAPTSTATPGEMVPRGMIEELVAGVRDQFELLARSNKTSTRVTGTDELRSRVSSLTSCAEATGMHNLARHSKALRNYLDQLCKQKYGSDDTALSKIRPAIAAMNRLCLDATGGGQRLRRYNVVIVDEAPGSNQALKQALLNAGFEPVCFADPPQARKHLTSHDTDVIIANVLLPDGHGLSLADIRQFPSHANTPVIFAPDVSTGWSRGAELPTSAARLDFEPLLLAELVLEALNQMQCKRSPAKKVFPARKRSGTNALGRDSVSTDDNANAEATLTCENGFEESVDPVQSRQTSTLDAISVPGEAVFQPLSSSAAGSFRRSAMQATLGQPTPAQAESRRPEDQLSGNIHIEPDLRPESSTTDADYAAGSPTILPSPAPTDGRQTDECPAEELPLADLQAETPQPAQAEQPTEGQADQPVRLEADAYQTGQAIPASQSAREFQSNKAAAVEELAAVTPDYEEDTSNQLQAIAPECAQVRQGNQQNQDQNMHVNQHEDSAMAACVPEMKVYRDQTATEENGGPAKTPDQSFAEATPPDRTSTVPGEPSVGEQKALARCAELEQEVAALRQVFEGLDGGLGLEQKAGAETSQKVEELEARLKQNGAELERRKVEQEHKEAEWRKQQEAANAASQQSEVARRQAESRCAELEQELAASRQARDELTERLKKLEAEPPTGEVGDQEQQLRQGVAELAQAKAELARERGEHQRSDERAAEMNGRLQTLHEDLRRMLQAQREDQARNGALEEQERQTRLALEQRTAEFEQQKDEYRLLEEQMHQVKEANAQLRHDRSFFEGANKKFDGAQQELQTRLEASLGAARENEARLQQESSERRRLTETLENVQRDLQTQTRRREILEQELQAAQAALQDREAKLHKEIAERQRLKEALDASQHNLHDGSTHDLEVSRLQSALNLEQVERNRQEAQLARTRRSALEAARAARALRTGLRRQIREPVDNLVHSAQSLLELETGDEQRKLAEAVLQDVLLVQTRLREPEPAHSGPAEVAEPATATGT